MVHILVAGDPDELDTVASNDDEHNTDEVTSTMRRECVVSPSKTTNGTRPGGGAPSKTWARNDPVQSFREEEGYAEGW